MDKWNRLFIFFLICTRIQRNPENAAFLKLSTLKKNPFEVVKILFHLNKPIVSFSNWFELKYYSVTAQCIFFISCLLESDVISLSTCTFRLELDKYVQGLQGSLTPEVSVRTKHQITIKQQH